MSPPAVTLRELDESVLQALLAAAVRDAEPEDVMAAVAGPPGWTQARRQAFLAYHRSRRPGLSGEHRERTVAVDAGGAVVGAGRLAVGHEPGVLEIGLWLVRAARGGGVGTAALRLLLREATAAGARSVVAETRADNPAAIGALARAGADLERRDADGPGAVRARLGVPAADDALHESCP